MQIITFQPALRPALPTVYGPVEYREHREQLIEMDSIIEQAGLEQEFLSLALAEREGKGGSLTSTEMDRFGRKAVAAFRSRVARKILGLTHRDFCIRLADSTLLQWFVKVGEVDQARVFGKSSCQRFEDMVSEESLRQMHNRLVALASGAGGDEKADAPFGLPSAVDCSEAFFDTTCVKLNIHFPVDWVLLRDAARSLMGVTTRIRNAGLKQRMPQSPEEFVSDMNKLCMAMSAVRRKKDSKKARKRVFRQMKALEKRIVGHAQAHRDLLEARWQETQLSEKEAALAVKRLDDILIQVPAAIKQANERIIGERLMPNHEKILSLYDADVEVIVRGKAGAETEFGNKLSLVESSQGLVLDYHLHKGNPADKTLVVPTIERLVDDMNLPVRSLWADRGMFSEANESFLEKKDIKSGLCPTNVEELRERMSDPEMRAGMKRRAQTEGRVGLFKNCFLGNPARRKNLASRSTDCGWAVMAHNLWVLARMVIAHKNEQLDEKAKRARGRPPARQAA